MSNKYLLTALLSFFSLEVISQPPGWMWANHIHDYNYSRNAIATDAFGHIYVAGSDNFFKYDTAGNLLWTKYIAHLNVGNSIAVDNSNHVYISGYFSTTVDFDPGPNTHNLTRISDEAFILKLDSGGNFVWVKQFASVQQSSASMPNDLAIDAQGNVLTTGYFSDTVDFDPGPSAFKLAATGSAYRDIFISKLDSNGNFVWAKRIGGGSGHDIGNSIAVDPAGNIFTTGNFVGMVDFNPGPGGYTLSGNDAGYVLKLDAAGNFVWATKVGTARETKSNSIALDPFGNIIVAGYYENLAIPPIYGAFIIKYDSSANQRRSCFTTVPWGNDASGECIAVDSAGAVVMTGYFETSMTLGTYTITTHSNWEDGFIAKYDSALHFVWAEAIGGNDGDEGFAVAFDNSGSLYTTGSFDDTVTFGSTVVIGVCCGNMYFAKLGASGPTGFYEFSERRNSLHVFPNPVTDVISLRMTGSGTVRIELYDLTGNLVTEITTEARKAAEINLSQLASGMYLLKVYGKDFLDLRKIIKQ